MGAVGGAATRDSSAERVPRPAAGPAGRTHVTAPMAAVMALQRSAGNHAVAGLLGGHGTGGGGGGGVIKPSTLAGDVAALSHGMTGAQQQAGGAAAALLA